MMMKDTGEGFSYVVEMKVYGAACARERPMNYDGAFVRPS